ncbi:MAG: hypothetical protein ACLT2T_08115 [Bilophila wadsworthia]
MGNPLHFIQASDTSAFAALHTEQGALPSQYEALQAYLKKIGLGRFGTLWAEPVTGQATPAGYASISWYTPLEGVGTPLSRLDAGEAEQARAALRRAREAVTPHLDDTPGGVLLRKALFIPSADNVFVVNGHPVLVNWGLLPQGTDEATAPILWGEPENGETPSGVTGAATAATGASAAAVAGTAARNAVPGAGRALALPPEQEQRARPERRPEPPQVPGQRRKTSSSGVARRASSEPCSSASCWAYSCFSCCAPA